MNYVALDNALYNDVANFSRLSNISINDVVKKGVNCLSASSIPRLIVLLRKGLL